VTTQTRRRGNGLLRQITVGGQAYFSQLATIVLHLKGPRTTAQSVQATHLHMTFHLDQSSNRQGMNKWRSPLC